MRYVALCHIKPGMVLAKPICNSNNVTLLGKNVTLTENFCDKIKGLAAVRGIYVYDEYDLIDKKEFKDVVDEEKRKQIAKSGKTFNLDAINFFSTSIVNNTRNSSTISHLMLELYNYSPTTFNHSIRVAEMAITMGVGLGFSNFELNELAMAALLHDIGKIKIDTAIIKKKGSLTPEETIIVKQHPFLGYEILKTKPRLSATVKCGVLMHHENEDGTGYPRGIKGDKIHKYAKIIHIADVFDAMINARSYKVAFSITEVIEYMMAKIGVMFDAKIFDVFYTYIEIFKVGEDVLLSNQEIAMVIENHPHYMLRPTIELSDKRRIDLHNDMNALNIVIIDKVVPKD